MRLFTIGYQGLTFDAFLRFLKLWNIGVVFDVRGNAISRKKGFSKYHLDKYLQVDSILYVHLPELGTPRPIRDELKKRGDYTQFFRMYNEFLEGKIDHLEPIIQAINIKNVALMCFEKEIEKCHRGAIAAKIQEKTNHRVIIQNIRTS